MAVVISPVNRKGGVGKSSSVYHLSGYFASQGLRVLCIDNEPQHSLTNGFLGREAAESLSPKLTTAALFDKKIQIDANDLIVDTAFKQIKLVAGSNALDQFNAPPENEPLETQLVVKHFVDKIRDQFDIVLIDNPPNLQMCSYSSLAASNFTYCITMPQEFDVQGLVPVQQAIDTVLRTTNPNLRFAGYVLNMVKEKRALHRAYEELLRQSYGKKVFRVTLPDWNDYAEALTVRKPISLFRPSSDASKRMTALTRELIERISDLNRKPPAFQHQAFGGNASKAKRTKMEVA